MPLGFLCLSRICLKLWSLVGQVFYFQLVIQWNESFVCICCGDVSSNHQRMSPRDIQYCSHAWWVLSYLCLCYNLDLHFPRILWCRQKLHLLFLWAFKCSGLAIYNVLWVLVALPPPLPNSLSSTNQGMQIFYTNAVHLPNCVEASSLAVAVFAALCQWCYSQYSVQPCAKVLKICCQSQTALENFLSVICCVLHMPAFVAICLIFITTCRRNPFATHYYHDCTVLPAAPSWLLNQVLMITVLQELPDHVILNFWDVWTRSCRDINILIDVLPLNLAGSVTVGS